MIIWDDPEAYARVRERLPIEPRRLMAEMREELTVWAARNATLIYVREAAAALRETPGYVERALAPMAGAERVSPGLWRLAPPEAPPVPEPPPPAQRETEGRTQRQLRAYAEQYSRLIDVRAAAAGLGISKTAARVSLQRMGAAMESPGYYRLPEGTG